MTEITQEKLERTQPTAGRRLRPLTMLIIMILPLALILALGWALIEANKGQLTSGPAPDFTLRTYSGEDFTLSDYRGKVILINFWASWCGPCRSEAPDLNAIWDEYRGRDFMMIGVGYLDNEKDALDFIQEFGIKYPTGHDSGNVISRAYRIQGVPETFIVDRAGNLDTVIIAPTTARALRPVLDRLLTESP